MGETREMWRWGRSSGHPNEGQVKRAAAAAAGGDNNDDDDDDVAVPKSLSYTYITHVIYLTPSVPHKGTVCEKS